MRIDRFRRRKKGLRAPVGREGAQESWPDELQGNLNRPESGGMVVFETAETNITISYLFCLLGETVKFVWDLLNLSLFGDSFILNLDFNLHVRWF